MTFDDISLEIYRLSEKVNEEIIKRIPDLNQIRKNCIALSAACNDMVKYCDEEEKQRMEFIITTTKEAKKGCIGCIFNSPGLITLDCDEIVKGLKVLGLPDCNSGIIYVKGEKK